MKTHFLKTILLFVSVLFLTETTYSQTEHIRGLEESLREASGPGRVGILLKLSEAYQSAGQVSKAADKAEEAVDFARRIKDPELRALALTREGNIMMARGKKKFVAKFEQSLSLLKEAKSNNKSLALENLENLRKAAMVNRKSVV